MVSEKIEPDHMHRAPRRRITAFSNPEIKRIRSLRDKKFRRREGQFLAEGLRLLTDALDAGTVPRQLVVGDTSGAHPLIEPLERAVRNAGGEVIETTVAILSKLSGKANPQTVIGVFDDLDTDLNAIDPASAPIWLAVQAMRDPGNLGTMMRTADAVGAGGVILIDECVDPFGVETVRASMGAIFTQRLARCGWAEFVQWRCTHPVQLVGTSLNTETGYRDADYRRPCIILVGNEARGLPAEYEAACDLLVRMPMLGRADSLNAAVAGSVMAYEVLARQTARS